MGIDEWDLKPMDSLNYRHSKDIAYEKPCGKEEQVPSKRLRVHKKRIRITALEIAGREQVWLWDFRQGVSTNTIASRERVSVRRVRFGVARAMLLRADVTRSRTDYPGLYPSFQSVHSHLGHRVHIIRRLLPARFYAVWSVTGQVGTYTRRCCPTTNQTQLPSQGLRRRLEMHLPRHDEDAGNDSSVHAISPSSALKWGFCSRSRKYLVWMALR